MKKACCGIFSCMLVALMVSANNIQITNVTTINNGSLVQVEFDLSWENSWCTASTNNWDGAWVFLKFKDNDGTWRHLHFTGANVVIPAGFTVTFSVGGEAGVGMFIYRSSNGFGNVSLTDVRAGITFYPGIYDVRAFAIEMVYIPQGSFFIGDGTSVTNVYSVGGASNTAYQVTGLGSTISMGTGSGDLEDPLDPSSTATLTGFPSGFPAYWIMKYELSQRGYIDFLNSLTYTQQVNNLVGAMGQPNSPATTVVFSSSNINGLIKVVTQGIATNTPAIFGADADNDNIFNEATDGEWNAMGFLNWENIAAYLDWAGLRPMTELEFEKACRGNLSAVASEFAWGTTITTITYSVSNNFQNNAAITNMSSTDGNAFYSGSSAALPSGGFRNGIFATAFSTRETSGAGYYGAMELSGNMLEVCVTTSNVAGRSFTGGPGDGDLNSFGYADVPFWPGSSGNTNVNAPNTAGNPVVGGEAGIMWRGGSANSGTADLRVSDRNAASNGTLTPRNIYFGIRGVRLN